MSRGVLTNDGFEQFELTEPKRVLEKIGAKTAVISPEAPMASRVLPGVMMNPGQLRLKPEAIVPVKAFDAGRQAGGGDRPRTVGFDQCGAGQEPSGHFVAVPAQGSGKCWRALGRQRSGARWAARQESQAGGHPAFTDALMEAPGATC